jgi:hypothetical protein
MVQQEFDCATHELRPSGQFDHARSPVPILDLLPDDDDDVDRAIDSVYLIPPPSFYVSLSLFSLILKKLSFNVNSLFHPI